jgi:peptide methionine sulfoxide reductase MsrA
LRSRPAIFYQDAEHKRDVEESKAIRQKTRWSDSPVVTEIAAAGQFYMPEVYHRDYYRKKSNHV